MKVTRTYFYLVTAYLISGNKPPGMVPSKGAYMNHDVARLAKYYQIPLHEMSNPGEVLFQKGSMPAIRFLTAVDMERPELTEDLSRALWMRIWSRDEDICAPESCIEAAKSIGMSEAEAQKYISRRTDAKTKDRVRQYTQEALDHGAFGTPTLIVQGEDNEKHMVFGSDRMHIIAMLLGEKYEGPLLEYAKSKL